VLIVGHCVFQVHLLNAPVFITNVMNLFRPFLKEKLVSKVTEFPPVCVCISSSVLDSLKYSQMSSVG
jgi:hypothetical protein